MDFMDTIHENPWEVNYIETGHDELADEGNSKLDDFWLLSTNVCFSIMESIVSNIPVYCKLKDSSNKLKD